MTIYQYDNSCLCVFCKTFNNVIMKLMTTNDIKTLISSDELRNLELEKTTNELKDEIY